MSTSRRASGVSLRQRQKLHAQRRVSRDERPERLGQIIGGEPVGRADAHVAGEFDVEVRDFALRVQEGALHLFGGGEETLAGAGQPRPGGAAVEQFGAERRLQRRDAAAGGGMVEMQPLGPGDELTGAGDGEEDADVVPIHATTISPILHA